MGTRWIWHKASGVNQYVQFIDTFIIEDREDISLHISADSQYAVWLNGELCAFGQYADYPFYKIYDKIDISRYVKVGENRLCVLGYCQGVTSSVYLKGHTGVWYEVRQKDVPLHESGDRALCRAAPDYVSGEMEQWSPQLGFTFAYDARGYDGWNLADYYAGRDWEAVTVWNSNRKVYPRPVAKTTLEERAPVTVVDTGSYTLTETETAGKRVYFSKLLTQSKAPVSFSGSPLLLKRGAGGQDGLYIIADLEQEDTGYLELELDAPAGTRVDIGFGEHLADGRVRTYIKPRSFAGSFTCRGGRETFTQLMKRAGLRYIQVHIESEAAVLHYAGIRPSHYPVVFKCAPELQSELHQKIYDTALRTLHLCMHEHYEDCPWREQALYAMDSRIQMLCGYYCFEGYEFAKASLRLLAFGKRQDGLLELCAPSTLPFTIPSFSLVWVTALGEYVHYSGDTAFGQEMLRHAKDIIAMFFARRNENALIPVFREKEYWNFYEWAQGLDGGKIVRDYELPETVDLPLNAFLSLALQSLSRLCRKIGRIADAEEYVTIWQALNAAIDHAFWHEERGLYNDTLSGGYSELAQALALCCGACPPDKKKRICAVLTEDNCGITPLTLSSYIYKYEALIAYDETYRKYVLNDIAEVWGKMLAAGATTFWETAEGEAAFHGAGSLCHGWTAVPVYFYHKYLYKQ